MNEKELSKIALKLKNRRTELGLSLEALSDKTGLSKSTLQRYETGGIANIPLDKLEILSNALNLSVSEFLDLKKDEYEENPIIRTVARNMQELSLEDQKKAKEMIDLILYRARKENE